MNDNNVGLSWWLWLQIIHVGIGDSTDDADFARMFDPAIPTDLVDIDAARTGSVRSPEFPCLAKAYETLSHSLPGGAKILCLTRSRWGVSESSCRR